MFHQTIKKCFTFAVDLVASCISAFTVNSDSELSRKRKLPADKLITFLVSQGSSGTKNELLDFFDMDAQAPSASAFNQQRAKLTPDALKAVFRLPRVFRLGRTFGKRVLQHAPQRLLRP